MLTGATGSIGAHTLAQLLTNERLEKIYCLVRGTDPLQRIFDSLTERRLQLSPSQVKRTASLSYQRLAPSVGLFCVFFLFFWAIPLSIAGKTLQDQYS